MIFAISMDYTVFLLSSAKEHWDRTHDPREAMVGGVAHSGRVIFAAAGVMVAVFFTFALSGPLPPKEMGVILGVAVLLDAFLVRLLLLPVILRLLGRWAWWLPKPLARSFPTSASATPDARLPAHHSNGTHHELHRQRPPSAGSFATRSTSTAGTDRHRRARQSSAGPTPDLRRTSCFPRRSPRASPR